MKTAFLLILAVGAATVRGRDLNQYLVEDEIHLDTEVNRPKRWSGISIFDSLRGKGSKGSSSGTKPTRPSGGDEFGFNLEDALHPDPQTSKPSAGKDTGFKLEDALRPAVKPTDKPSGGDCQASVVQKLREVIEKQNQQLRLLAQLLARSSSGRLG